MRLFASGSTFSLLVVGGAVRSFLTPARALESNSRKKLANYRLANAETDIDNEIHYRRVSCF
jgi:hypothetical protein